MKIGGMYHGWEVRNTHKRLVGKLKRENPLAKPLRRSDDNDADLKTIQYEVCTGYICPLYWPRHVIA
jgi:hypothetical protein